MIGEVDKRINFDTVLPSREMMGGGYAMPAKTTMMAKGGAVKKAPANKGK